MPSCVWGFCHCPDGQPCVEHQGFYCSLWNGTPVSKETDVNDAITRDAELALVALGRDRSRLASIEADLRRKQAELEKERDFVDQGLRAAGTYSQRKAVADVLDRWSEQIPKITEELRKVETDLASISGRATSLGNGVSFALIIPFSSGSGYCACYREKRRRLTVLANRSANERTNVLAPLLAQRGAMALQVRGMFSPLPNPGNLGKVFSSALIASVIVAFLIFGIAAWVKIVLFALIIILIMLIILIIALVRIDRGLLDSRRVIVATDLLYYRNQSITTCQKPAASIGTGGPKPPIQEENAWIGPAQPNPDDFETD